MCCVPGGWWLSRTASRAVGWVRPDGILRVGVLASGADTVGAVPDAAGPAGPAQLGRTRPTVRSGLSRAVGWVWPDGILRVGVLASGADTVGAVPDAAGPA
ncbi:hypothetical protein, partial [Streptomyces viridiviolaceus]|uniref:hypothetical protein n=1 Tax=Streptomyces viridiviolaceus TaxID=68282 RepID=UPI001E6547EF